MGVHLGLLIILSFSEQPSTKNPVQAQLIARFATAKQHRASSQHAPAADRGLFSAPGKERLLAPALTQQDTSRLKDHISIGAHLRLPGLQEAQTSHSDHPSAAEIQGVQASAASDLAGLPSGVSDQAAPAPLGEELRRYRMALALEARHHKRYPGLARAYGWEGATEVWVQFSPGLVAPVVHLGKTSGYEALDLDALAMVSLAVQRVQAPAVLFGRGTRLSVAIQYRLDE